MTVWLETWARSSWEDQPHCTDNQIELGQTDQLLSHMAKAQPLSQHSQTGLGQLGLGEVDQVLATPGSHDESQQKLTNFQITCIVPASSIALYHPQQLNQGNTKNR